MSLERLQRESLIEEQPVTAEEIAHLAELLERDLAACATAGLSPDWRFAIAYSAALQAATIVVRASGHRALSGAHHYATFAAFGAIVGEEYTDRIMYLQACRNKRNRAEYEQADRIGEAEVTALIEEARELRDWVAAWLSYHHPELMPETWRRAHEA